MTKTIPNSNPAGPSKADPFSGALLSHDIRSALTGIVSATQALEAAGLRGAHAAQLAQIHSAALYINALIDAAGEGDDHIPISDLEPMLKELETMWAPEMRQKGLAFEISRKGILPSALHLPQIDFLRILNNIIGNALKFTSSGAIDLRLARVKNGALLIEIADDGPGFSEAAQAKLYALHGRPEGEVATGSGFGLYIAKQLVEKAGGEIVAESRRSGGARVSVILPEDLLIAATRPKVKPDSGLPDLSHLKILLAEDNPTNQLVASQMLKKMDAVVEVASDGVEAMEAFERGNFDLGLIDIEMPRKSGLEVMREMRARPDEKAATTLLALTAYVLPEHRDRIMASGADGIIAKPLTNIAAFGNAILIVTGEGEDAAEEGAAAKINPDADIQMDVYNGLEQIIGHDSMLELLGKVQSDLAEVKSGVEQGVADADAGPIRANTHILISVAGAIGAVNLQHIAETLNATAKNADWARVEAESRRCIQGISDVLCFVRKELEG